jgi:uncharacterized protein
MRIDNSFQVPAAPEEVWRLLGDVPRIVPCMPGAELIEQVDESTWKASMKVKLGPISMTFATDVRQEKADEAAYTMRLAADAREARGRGSARATIETTVTAAEDGSAVNIATDLNLSGAVAQYGRGIVHDVSNQLVASFADCLRAQLLEQAPPAKARPVSGLQLLLRALLGRLRRPRGRAEE